MLIPLHSLFALTTPLYLIMFSILTTTATGYIVLTTEPNSLSMLLKFMSLMSLLGLLRVIYELVYAKNLLKIVPEDSYVLVCELSKTYKQPHQLTYGYFLTRTLFLILPIIGNLYLIGIFIKGISKLPRINKLKHIWNTPIQK